MSWNPFKKAEVPRRSVISKNAEREFEREVKKVEDLDEATKKLYKDGKRSTEYFAALSKSQVQLTQDLVKASLMHQEAELLQLVEEWAQNVAKEDQLTQELNTITTKALIEPLKRYSSIFPCLYAAVKKREQALQEYNRCQARVEKYQDRERTGPNIVKLDQSKKALAAAKEEFQSQHSQLSEDIPKLYDGRIDFIKPCLQALYKAQVTYFTETHKICSEISASMNSEKDLMLQDSDYEKVLQQKLNEIKALSIVADD